MQMNLFGLGMQGKSPNVSSNRLVNCYYEFVRDGDRTNIAIYGTPGLEEFIDQGDTPWRGLHVFESDVLIYGVHRDTVYSINNAGIVTNLGQINTSSGRVDMADNGTEIIIVDGTDGWIYDTGADTLTQIADADFPAANTVCFDNGRFLVDKNNTGQFWGSNLYDGTAWDTLDFATAETQPDNLIRLVNDNGRIIMFGDNTTEFWSYRAGVSGFPYFKITNGEFGLASRWSVARFLGTHAFLARNREGQVTPAILNGYQYQTISNPEFDSIINGYSSALDATFYSYMLGGHPMLQMNFPSVMKSWLYDATTKYISELEYTGNARHRAELGVDFVDNKIVADHSNGKLYKLKDSVYTDNGEIIPRRLTGKRVFGDGKKVRIPRLQITGETGVGLATGQGSDPQMIMQISRDGGNTFGTEQWRSWGKVGEYQRRAIFGQNGAGRDLVFKLKYSEPTKFVLTGAVFDPIRGMS